MFEWASEWVKTIQNIISGKARGSKLIVFGTIIILISIYIEINYSASPIMLSVPGMFCIYRGLAIYEAEAIKELSDSIKDSD